MYDLPRDMFGMKKTTHRFLIIKGIIVGYNAPMLNAMFMLHGSTEEVAKELVRKRDDRMSIPRQKHTSWNITAMSN